MKPEWGTFDQRRVAAHQALTLPESRRPLFSVVFVFDSIADPTPAEAWPGFIAIEPNFKRNSSQHPDEVGPIQPSPVQHHKEGDPWYGKTKHGQYMTNHNT